MKKLKQCLLFLLLYLLLLGLPVSLYADSSVQVGIYKNKPLLFTDSDNRPQGIFGQSLTRWVDYPSQEPTFPKWVIGTFILIGSLLIIFFVLSLTFRTQIRQRTTELLTSETRYRTLVENIPVGFVSFDRTGAITTVNPALLEILNSPSTEETKKLNMLTFPPLVKSGVSASIRHSLESGERVVVEHSYTSKWGKTSYLRSVFTPTRNEEGKIIGGQALVEDITRQKQVEAALRESEQSFQTLLNSITDYVWSADIVDRQVLYRYYSPVVEKITGYPPDYFMTDVEAWLNIIHPEDRARVEKEIALELEGQVVTHEYRIIQPNGRVKWVHGTTSPTLDENGEVIRLDGVVSDITERKRLEKQLQQAQKMEAIGRLAGGIAHDFNNMLTAIMGYAELASTLISPDNPGLADIQGIQKVADRAARLTQQLLAFARRQVSEPRAFNFNNLILNVDNMLRRLIGEDIELVILLDPDLGYVEIDPGQFEQVLVNLAVNARDAMPEGGKLTVETSNLSVDREFLQQQPEVEPGQYVMLTVTDTGVGMSEEVKAHLFEPFFTTKEVGQGTGLGLATCFGVVKQSGGYIWVHSEAEQGTSFKICLPRIEKETAPLFDLNEPDYLLPGIETILLVEDEITVRELAARTLRQQGYTVLAAASGTEAIRILQDQVENGIDLLLTDVVMPHMGGVELADQVKAIQPETKIIFMSGYTDSTLILPSLPTTGGAFLPKPFTPGLLLRKVREVLDDRKTTQTFE